MQILKKWVLLFLCAALVLSCAACDSSTAKNDSTPAPGSDSPANQAPAEPTPAPLDNGELTAEEQEKLDTLLEDTTVITDETFGQTVYAMINDPGDRLGQLFQLEGQLVQEGETWYVARTMVNGEERTELRLPLAYMSKNLAPDSWVRVFGILNTGDVNGETLSVLEVHAIEVMETPGNGQLSWSGPEA